MVVKSAADGKGPRDAMNLTAPSTSALAVAPSHTMLSSVVKPKDSPPMTPYKPNEWHVALESAGLLTQFHDVPTGLCEGFTVDFPIISRIQNPPNKESVNLYLNKFNKIISKETDKKRYLGPFTLPTLVNLIGLFQSFPISIIPKPGQPGKFRLIQNFSYPLTPSHEFPSPSINSFISVGNFPTTWGTFKIVALLIARLPPGLEAATRDVAEVYRTIPLHPSQWPAVVIRAPDKLYYIDKCLLFGAAPSAGAYGHVADAAAEIFRLEGIGPLDKWVDDHVFFRVKRVHLANYNDCQTAWNLDIQNSGPISQSGSRLVWYASKDHASGIADEFNEDCSKPIQDLSHQSHRSEHDALFTYCLDDINKISDRLGIPWEKSKDQLFASSTTYIGFVWDLNSRSVSLAVGKIEKYRNAIREWSNRPTHMLKDVQQLYGELLHASATLREGRAYLTGLEHMLKVCSDKPFMPHRPVKSVADDLLWWDESLRSGRVKLSIPPHLLFADIQAFSDASSSMGMGIVISGRWRAWRLLPGWKNAQGVTRDIGWAKAVRFEMLICTINILHTGLTKVVIYGDNTGIIEGWWAGRHRNPETNNIFQRLHSFLAQINHGRTVHTCYVPSAENPVDSPSRGKYPPAHLLPRIPIPPPLVPFIIDANDPLTPVEQEFTPSPPNFSSNSLHSRRRNIQDSHSRWRITCWEENDLVRQTLI
jgi:hypothetical protein